MKRLTPLLLCSLLAIGLTGCLKMNTTVDVKNDASAAMKISVGVKTESIETIKGLMESMGDMGGAEVEQAEEAFAAMESMLDEKKVAQQLKDSGLEVTKATKTEEDGWKGIQVEAKVKNLNEWLDKTTANQKKQLEDMDMPMSLDGLTTFFKTDTQGVGEIVIIPPLSDLLGGDLPIDLEELEDLGDDELDQLEQSMEMFKQMLSVDDMALEIIINLPGKIVATKGCKKSGENGLKFTFKGGDIGIEDLSSLFGFKDGISATFEIPEGCKIQFKDKKGEAKAEADDAKKDEEKKEKKGGLKIGGGKKG
ncbi:MAG: hypothetical protein CMJ90_12090 [Planctomycetes bacterium]|nr:hypothetical protein [Planctomycetota bacterium]